MNRKFILSICCLILLALTALWVFQSQRRAASNLTLESGSATNTILTGPHKSAAPAFSPAQSKSIGQPFAERRARAIAEIQDEWRAPIDFFGRVADENNNPVPDVKIEFGWTDLSI